MELVKTTIKDNDIRIKNHLQKIYKDKPIPSKVLRDARVNGVEINGKKIKLRTGLNAQYKFGDLTFAVDNATRFVEKGTNPTWKGITPKKGLFKDADAVRRHRSTGMIGKEFAHGGIIRQARRLQNLFDEGKVPEYVGEKANNSIKKFLAAMNKSWSDRGEMMRLIQDETGIVLHQGHSTSAQQGGPNIFNVEPQPALATDYKGQIGAGGLSANIQQGEKTIKAANDLRFANLSTNLQEAYNAWLMDDAEGIQKSSDLLASDRAKVLHDPTVGAEAQTMAGYHRLEDEALKRKLNLDNVFTKNSTTNNIIKLIKKKSGKIKDIAIGKTRTGTLARGVGLLQYLDWFDPTEATELKFADVYQGRTPLTKESVKDVASSYGKDLKETGGAIATTMPVVMGAAKVGSVLAPGATATAMSTAGPFAALMGGVMLFDSYDNMFHDGKIKEWFKKNDPGRKQAEGAAITSIPGDFDYKPNQGTYKGMPIPQI